MVEGLLTLAERNNCPGVVCLRPGNIRIKKVLNVSNQFQGTISYVGLIEFDVNI